MGDCLFRAIFLCAILILTQVRASEEMRCALILAFLDDPHDLSDVSLRALADLYDDRNDGRRAELIRVSEQIDRLMRERGLTAPALPGLLARRRELMRNVSDAIEIPFRRQAESPFQNNSRHLHRINPPKESFVLGRKGSLNSPERRVRITKPFDMSDLITQAMWAKVFKRNPSMNTKSAIFRAGQTLVDPHLPVESISFWSALVYANRVSEIEGRTPAYDLSQVNFADVPRGDTEALLREAGAGTLRVRSGNFSVRKEANGYRLPTDAQWEYVARGGEGHPYFRAKNYYGDNDNNAHEHAWFGENTRAGLPEVGWENFNFTTQRVATKRANALGVHDMIGNVDEWIEDPYTIDLPGSSSLAYVLPPGNPAVADFDRALRTLRGGDYGTLGHQLGSHVRRSDSANPFGNQGFRLVRPVE